jgi:antitoxin (DNA-binding transcriptional repressor) of toxin-antitoxin stability system
VGGVLVRIAGSSPVVRSTKPQVSRPFRAVDSRSRSSVDWQTAVRSTSCYSSDMSREITQRELRNQSGEIMRELDGGETFIVTRNGVPVGELTPLRRHRFVAAETAVAMFGSAPSVDYKRFRADLDTAASQDPAPRG